VSAAVETAPAATVDGARPRRWSRWSRRRRPLLLGELVVVLCLLRVYDLARAHAEVRRTTAISHGEAILRLERWLHLDIEHAVNVWTTSHQQLSLAASHVYQFAHIPVTLTVLGWCWLLRPELYRRARTALVLVNVTGLAVFLLLPVAPPRLLPGSGFVDAVAAAGFGTTHSGPIEADQYGAMPSLHLAWAVWSAVVAYWLVRRQLVKVLWVLYPVLVTAVVVMTANHYLLDLLAGAGVASAALAVSGPHRVREYGGS
jgi:membrane-associated phospholipid phosphatase